MPGVHAQRLEVADREVAAREQLELQHRLRRPPLVERETRRRRRCRRGAGRRSRDCPTRSGAARSARTRCRRARARRALRRGNRRAAPRPSPSPGQPRGRAASVPITTGTLSAKIQRHESWSTIQPPASGPTIAAIPPQAVHDPIAAPRSFGREGGDDDRERRRRHQRRGGALEARAAIRTSIVGANAQATEKTPNPARPSTKTRRSP